MASTLHDSYQRLVTHYTPGPNSVSYFIPLLLLPTALLIPPSILSHSQLSYTFLPLIYACFLHSCFYGGGLDVISANVVVWSTVLIALEDVRGTYKRIHHPQQPPEHTITPLQEVAPSLRTLKWLPPRTWEEPYPSRFLPRIPWVLSLITSLRLINWSMPPYSRDALPPLSPLTRASYLRHALLIALTSYLLLDTAVFAALHDPYFTTRSLSILSPHPSFPSMSPLPLRALLLALHIYAPITLGGALFTTPLLLLPAPYSPHTHPMFFGPVAAIPARGLRGLWGAFWHQTMRYPTSLPGRGLARRLGYGPHSKVDYTLRVLSAFGLSGWIHGGLVPPEPLGEGVSAWRVRGAVMGFFWVQVVGIGVEVGVEKVVRRTGWGVGGGWMGVVRKAGVLLWVAGWLCGTLPLLGWAGKELGWFGRYPLPVSVWVKGMEGRWVP
ncbi:hypothetical protein MMC13_002808 [Lambiella insularis]|nr:hypothetical protein [Lambiella insularis]